MEKTALLTTFAAALLAAAQSATAPSVGRTVPREEIAKTWRLIARDIEMHDKARPLPRRDAVVRFTTFQPSEAEVANREALILKEDRDPLDVLLRRTRALCADLSGQVDLSKEGKAFDEIAAAASAAAPEDEDARFAVFTRLMRIRKAIAFRNPLLSSVEKLLFITREAFPTQEYNWGTHICDQFFGFHARSKESTHGDGL